MSQLNTNALIGLDNKDEHRAIEYGSNQNNNNKINKSKITINRFLIDRFLFIMCMVSIMLTGCGDEFTCSEYVDRGSIELHPNSRVLGNVPVGNTHHSGFFIRNHDSQSSVIVTLTVNDEMNVFGIQQYHNTTITLYPKQDYYYSLAFTPDDSISYNAYINFHYTYDDTYHDNKFNNIRFSVSGSGAKSTDTT